MPEENLTSQDDETLNEFEKYTRVTISCFFK